MRDLSCIAAGSDSTFADVVLDLGGQLVAVLPSTDYHASKVKPARLSSTYPWPGLLTW
jgi:hypothetical protein